MIGPCAKQIVKAIILTKCGKKFVATNECENPQDICPRIHLQTGEGYEMCRDICKQIGHAEVNVIKKAKGFTNEATLYLEGHTYACEDCKEKAKLAGISEIVIL